MIKVTSTWFRSSAGHFEHAHDDEDQEIRTITRDDIGHDDYDDKYNKTMAGWQMLRRVASVKYAHNSTLPGRLPHVRN